MYNLYLVIWRMLIK